MVGSTAPVDEPPAKRARGNGAKSWVFTWNNYPDKYQIQLFEAAAKPGIKAYSWGEEIGEQGTRHIQGYLETQFKVRWNWFGLPPEIHWAPARGSRQHNTTYTQKDGTNVVYSANMAPPEPLRFITELRPWQDELENLIKQQPDDRTIHWIWENIGGIGKSALVKRWAHLYGAQVCAGKAADMKYQLTETDPKPRIVIFDVPRSSFQYISYQGMEEIKNGCFASTKFKSTMVLYNPPHVIVFANEPPDRERLSADRWRVGHITAEGLQWT